MLEYIIFNNSLKNWFISLVIILLFIGIGRLFSSLVIGIIKKIAKRTKTMLDDILINVLEKPLIFALFIAGFAFAVSFLDFGINGSKRIANIVEILIVLNIIWILVRLVDAMVEHYLMPLVQKSESKIDDQIMPFARKFVKVSIIIIGLIFLIAHLGYDVTSLIAGLGIGGLAFALAAQPLLSNLFGGLSIIADKPFQLGDRIKVDQKYEGYVKEIGMRSTRIKTPNDTVLTIPNSIIAATVVENLSSVQEHSIRIVFNLGIAYETSNAKVKETIDIVKKILYSQESIVKDKPELAPFVSFNEFRDSSLNINIGYSVNNSSKLSATRNAVNLAIKEQFEKAGIQFAYPTQTVHVKKNKE
jgi:MscS family membrane protein